ncbi:DisA checkpoint controller nucleotide-binding [Paenibacillus algorifonticola]|uniref:DisA checkpoint controller nucleotide-binding n=1 Tax=Paenibacillus algorifonticola TaxID=684063 RepID=A0A1I2E5K0_9BACL|nr:diadenylate cyclase [Paenibacillus algorifonticola]SFE87798.1 DisA checkpoint controller nucleotide-binding [Paenibacillus algorifonticola]
MSDFEDINKTVYENLEQILQKLDDRLDLKLFAIVINDENQKWIEKIRVKNVLSDEPGKETEVIQEELNSPEEVFKQLSPYLKKPDGDLKQFILELENHNFNTHMLNSNLTDLDASENEATIESNNDLPFRPLSRESAVFYFSFFNLEVDKNKYTIKYILSIEYLDVEARTNFLERPNLSFLRMLLDYYFSDFYRFTADGYLFVNDDQVIEIKYKENSTQFLQRMARLFFGKIQDFIVSEVNLLDLATTEIDLSETLRNQYYINNLFEKIDGISTRTYEGESPFGCMLLLKTSMLDDSKLIKYLIRFQNHLPLNLEDSRRIRKLLELTNNERDLYLIADDRAIYGVGEIDWSQLKDNLVFKIEFKGLSRYDLLLVTTEEKQYTDARVVAEEESKIFKMTMNLEIISHNLTSISFQHPGIGASGFNAELFKRTMKTQFKEVTPSLTDEAIEKLRLVIQKATEQQSGSMVVITDRETAETELIKLGKQSTPILTTEINPAFIKYLTSIDGAIYFDTSGACHAIGVILDGLAQPHLGDSSRGARFHSAYHYLEKLKGTTGCVIAIISEDGMVNLIPEQVNEKIVRQLVREMISHIRDNDKLSDETIKNDEIFKDYERRLEEAARETDIDHHHFFKIAIAFFEKKHYKDAASYYKKGLDKYGHFNLEYDRKFGQILILNALNTMDSERELEYYKETLEQLNKVINNTVESARNLHDYNRRALALQGIAAFTSSKKQKTDLLRDAISDITISIGLKKTKKNILYHNRGSIYLDLKNEQEAVNDFIASELESSEELTISYIEKLIMKTPSIYLHALSSYVEKKNSKKDSKALEDLLRKYGAKLSTESLEVAAALEQYGMDDQVQNNENEEI